MYVNMSHPPMLINFRLLVSSLIKKKGIYTMWICITKTTIEPPSMERKPASAKLSTQSLH